MVRKSHKPSFIAKNRGRRLRCESARNTPPFRKRSKALISSTAAQRLRLFDWVCLAEFFACFFGCEHPVDLGFISVALLLPSGDFYDELIFVIDAAIEALAAQDLQFKPKMNPK